MLRHPDIISSDNLIVFSADDPLLGSDRGPVEGAESSRWSSVITSLEESWRAHETARAPSKLKTPLSTGAPAVSTAAKIAPSTASAVASMHTVSAEDEGEGKVQVDVKATERSATGSTPLAGVKGRVLGARQGPPSRQKKLGQRGFK